MELLPLNDELIPDAASVERQCLETAWTEQQLRELPASAIYLVARCDGAVCGIGSLYCSFEEAELMNLAVLPQYRRRGIAQALLTELTACARVRGCEQIFLEVAAGNHAAQRLYETNGFEAVGRRPHFYRGEDALLMRKQVC